jgi:parallel beta-helix repeat protein
MDPEAVASIGPNNNLVSHVAVTNGHLKSTATWRKLNVPYHMMGGTVYVGSETGITWTIEPGTTIMSPRWSDIMIGGFTTSKATLIANGTAAEPITFTSIKPTPATDERWGALHFGIGTNPLTSLKHCVVENGGITGNTGERAVILIKDCSINIESTKIVNSFDYAILLNNEGSFGKFINNTIDNSTRDGIYLHANWAHTIGTGNTFTAGRGILVRSGIITQSAATWLKQPVPYIITGVGNLSIYNSTPEGAKLTLSPGVQVLISINTNIAAGGYGKGAFVANGTAARDPKGKGDWGRIQFGTYTTSGILNHCILEYGGYNQNGIVEISYTNTPVVTNCVIRNSAGYGIVLQNASPTLSGNTFSGNTLGDVY